MKDVLNSTLRTSVRSGVVLALFVVVSLLAYHNVLGAFFIADDFGILDGLVERGLSLAPFANFVRPIVSVSWAIDYELWKFRPWGYHLTNIVLHALNAFAVFLVFRLLFERTAEFRDATFWAISAGLLFLVMPSHSGAVAWIAGRVDLIATSFALFALLAYLHFKDRHRKASLIASLVLFGCALLSKESVVSFPFIIALFEWYDRQKTTRSGESRLGWVRLPALYVLLLVLYLGLRMALLGTLVGGYGTNVHLDFHYKKLTGNLVTYTARALLPKMPSVTIHDAVVLGLFVVILATVIVLARYSTRQLSGTAIVLIGCFVVALLPVLNLGVSKVFVGAERLLYWPSAFVAMLLVIIIHYVSPRPWRASAILIALSLLYSLSLYHSNEGWRHAAEYSKRMAVLLTSYDSERDTFSQYYRQCMFELMKESEDICDQNHRVFALSRLLPPPEKQKCLLMGGDDCFSKKEEKDIIRVFTRPLLGGD